MTPSPTPDALDLVREITRIVRDGDDHGTKAEYPTSIKVRQLLESAAGKINSLTAEVARLREGLRPFAEQMRVLHWCPDGEVDACNNFIAIIDRALSPSQSEAGEWKPISEAGEWEVVLTYSPPENLYENPNGRPGEIHYTCRHKNTWATHFLKIELPPFPSSQTGTKT